MQSIRYTKIIDFYSFYDNEYLTLKKKNKKYFIYSRTIDAEFNKAVFMETSTTKDMTIKIFKTTVLPEDFFEKINSKIKVKDFLNKVLICSKVSNIEGFLSIKEIDYFSYDKKRKELSIPLYFARLNYSLTLQSTRKPFSNINKSHFTIKKLLKQEILNENEKDNDKYKENEVLLNLLEKESSFLIKTENFPETDFYKDNEFNEEYSDSKVDIKEEIQLILNEKDEYIIEKVPKKEKPSEKAIEEVQENLDILLPIKQFTFYYKKNERNKIKWAFANIKSNFYFPIIHNNLIYYNHLSQNNYIIIALLSKMDLCLNVNYFKEIINRNRKFISEKYLLSYLYFIDAFLVQIFKFFSLVTNNISNSFKNVLINTFLKEFEIRIDTMLKVVINIFLLKQRIINDCSKDSFNKDAIILFMKELSHEKVITVEKFNQINVPYFLRGMRVEFREEEAENILDIFFYNKESLLFMDDFALKTTLLEELLIEKFDIYVTQFLDENADDIYYSTLPFDIDDEDEPVINI